MRRSFHACAREMFEMSLTVALRANCKFPHAAARGRVKTHTPRCESERTKQRRTEREEETERKGDNATERQNKKKGRGENRKEEGNAKKGEKGGRERKR